MSGRDRVRGPRAHDPVLRSARMVERATRMQDEYLRRHARARTELERFVVAVDFLRSAESACYRAGVRGVDAVLREITADLLNVGQSLTADLVARGRGTPQHGHLPHEPHEHGGRATG